MTYLLVSSYDGGCFVNLGCMIEQAPMNNTLSGPLHSINDIWEFIASDIPEVIQLHANNISIKSIQC